MIEINIDTTQAINLLFQKSNNVSNFNKILTSIIPIIKKEVKDNFDGEHNPDGSFWQKSKSPKTLQKSGDLYRDMQDDKNYQINDDSISIFTSVLSKGKKPVYYGKLHNDGGRFVKRTFAGISNQGFTKILNKISEVI